MLGEEQYKRSVRIVVRGVKPDAEAARYADDIKGSVVVSIGDQNIEGLRLDSKEIGRLVKNSPRPLEITFRDPNRFFSLLQSSDGTTEDKTSVSTVLRPGSGGRPAQVLNVDMLHVSHASTRNVRISNMNSDPRVHV